MSATYYTICKRYYDQGIYSDDDLKRFVKSGKLTKDEYEKITGNPYKEDKK